MLRFLFGAIVGGLAAYFLQERSRREELETRFRELQDRTGAVLEESRRILDETRGELSQALEAGRVNVQQKAERLREAAVSEHPTRGPGGPTTGGSTTTV